MNATIAGECWQIPIRAAYPVVEYLAYVMARDGEQEVEIVRRSDNRHVRSIDGRNGEEMEFLADKYEWRDGCPCEEEES